MNRDLLLQYFDRISEAPDAVPRLRRFILDLAVRGKLVEQNPSDEPTTELLKRIELAKAKRIKAGEIRIPRSLEWTDDIEELYAIPSIWKWVRLAEVGAIVGGGTPPSGDADNLATGGTGIAWLTPADLGKFKGLYVSHGARDLTEKGLRSSSATLMPKGSVLFTSRAPIGYTAIALNAITTNQGFKSVVPFIADCSRYVALYLQAFAPWIDSKASGTTFREVSGKIVSGLPFPLPPLAEQHRIVAKVDELMVLCDQLEAERNKREARRDRLVASSLNRISTTTAEEAKDATRFHLNHLPRLTTRTEHIKQLRQMLLDLVFKGLLSERWPDDGLGVDLIKEVAEHWQEENAKIRKSKSPEITDFFACEPAFPTPDSWGWARLHTLCEQIGDIDHKMPRAVPSGVPFLSAKDLKDNGELDFSNPKYISEEDFIRLSRKVLPRRDDIIYSRIGAKLGKARLVEVDTQFLISYSCCLVRPLHKIINKHFLQIFLDSHLALRQAHLGVKSIGVPDLGLGEIKAYRIPLPPLAEQFRIVAKVDELMALCDQMEVQLTTTEADSRRLLEAVLRDALNASAITS